MTVTYASRESRRSTRGPQTIVVEVNRDGRSAVAAGPPVSPLTKDQPPIRTVRLFWTGRGTAPGRPAWQAFNPTPGQPTRVFEVPDPPAGGLLIAEGWEKGAGRPLNAVPPGADRTLLDLVNERWRPEYCLILDALSAAIEATAIAETRIVIWMGELPPVVAELLVELTSQASSTGELDSVSPAALVRAFGSTLCLAVGRGATCALVHQGSVDVTVQPTIETMYRLGASRVVRCTSGALAALAASEATRAARVLVANTEAEPAPPPGLERSRRRLREIAHAPDTPSRFGRT